jgi:hypothetical protein
VALVELPVGAHVVEVVGQDFAGVWQTNATRSRTWFVAAPGDAKLDGRFDQVDIVLALQASRYGLADVAEWSEGDWNRDGLFNQLDIGLRPTCPQDLMLLFGTGTSPDPDPTGQTGLGKTTFPLTRHLHCMTSVEDVTY